MISRSVGLGLLLLLSIGNCHGDLVFYESIGSGTGMQSIAMNSFLNSGTLSFTGTADTRTTNTSSTYLGASGGKNVFFNNSSNSPIYFTIGGINTSGFIAGSLKLSFGGFKSTAANDFSNLRVSYSTNGSTFIALPALTGGPTGASWTNDSLFSFADSAIPVTTTLSLRWENLNTNNVGTDYRIDDISLRGDITAVPEPTSLVFGCLLGAAGFMVVGRKRKWNLNLIRRSTFTY